MACEASCDSRNPSTSAVDVGSLFFPLTPLIGVDADCNVTPLLLRKVVYAGSHSSFKQAAEGLDVLAEVSISSQRVRRCTEKIGNERVAQVEQAAASFESIPLPDRQKCPEAVRAPQVACVQMDGGRIQIRQRQATVDDDLSSDASETEGQDPQEVAERKGKFWRESKVACLLSMVSEKSLTDPHPTIPAIFIDPGRIKRLCSEIKRKSATESELAQSSEPPDNTLEEALDQMDETEPSIVFRHVIASRENSTTFGAQMAAEAYRLGFNAAPRKAYVCDGQSANWRVWQRWFSHYTPIVDFVHAVCYVYAAAMAGSIVEQGWADYLR